MTLYRCFVPIPQQFRAMRVLLGWDEFTACQAANLTPDQLHLVEDLKDSELSEEAAGEWGLALIHYAEAIVKAGGIMRFTMDGDNHLYDAVIPKRPIDEFVFDPGSVTPTQLRAARIGVGASYQDFLSDHRRGVDADEMAIIEGFTMSNSLLHSPQWWSTGTFLSLTFAMREAGIFLIDPATTGNSEFGIRFRVKYNG